jgi:cellulose biosynthesis protein BcsQ
MSKIHFVGGEKGGVGKSVLARLLAQYHIDRGLPFTAFDTDRSHGALLRFYGDFSRPMVLDDFESADQLMEAALEADHDVLVDLAAQTSLPLHRWIDQNDLLALAEAGLGLMDRQRVKVWTHRVYKQLDQIAPAQFTQAAVTAPEVAAAP